MTSQECYSAVLNGGSAPELPIKRQCKDLGLEEMKSRQPMKAEASGPREWFPAWYILVLFFATSAVRVAYVSQPQNWWTLHPDEVYQATEVAHTEVYGYGFRAYEFNPPLYQFEISTPEIRKREQGLGMAALRSYLLPHFYVTVSWVLGALGLHFHPFLTWKVFHSLVTSTLVLTVYRYVTVLFRSRDTACLAATLCAACAQLHVLGTHTVVNSLLAPFVFLVLAHLHTLVAPQEDIVHDEKNRESGSRKIDGSGEDRLAQVLPKSKSAESSLKQKWSKKSYRNKGKQEHPPNKPPSRNVLLIKSLEADMADMRCDPCGSSRTKDVSRSAASRSSQNGSYACSGDASLGLRCTATSLGGTDDPQTRSLTHTFGYARIYTQLNNGAAGGAAGPQENCAMNGLDHSDRDDKKPREAVSTVSAPAAAASHTRGKRPSWLWCQVSADLLTGLLLGLIVYIRVDLGAPFLLVLLPHWRLRRTRYGRVLACLLGGLGGVAVGVAEDFRCYGWGVLTPWNWFRFNIQKDYAAVLFGTDPPHKYLTDVFGHNLGVSALSLLSLACLLSQFYTSRDNDDSRHGAEAVLGKAWRGRLRKVCISWVLLLALYSSQGHKELRFVHNVVVLVLITFSVLIQSSVLKLLPSRHQQQRWVLAVGVALFLFSQWRDVGELTQGGRGRGGNRMAFQQDGDTQDVNACLYRLSSRHDVTGVFLDKNLYATAGYTILHKEVPIFTVFGNNFLEYRLKDRLRETTKFPWIVQIGSQGAHGHGPTSRLADAVHQHGTVRGRDASHELTPPGHGDVRQVFVSYVAQFSNFVTRQNSFYVMKYVLDEPLYNFFVVHEDKGDFSTFGLTKLFSCGVYKVYKRPAKPTPDQGAQLRAATSDEDPPGNTSTLLQEADVLYLHGAWARAAERYRQALRSEPGQAGVYFLLASCAYHLRRAAASAAPTTSGSAAAGGGGGGGGRSDREAAALASAQLVMDECYAKFPKEQCEIPRDLTAVANGSQ